MKRKLSVILSTMLVASTISVPVLADTNVSQDINIVVSGSALELDQPPVIIDNRTLVPLRAVAEAVGGNVDWNNDTKTVTITKDDLSLSLEIGKTTVVLNNTELELDVPAQIINSRTMVPLRFIAESFGLNVDWNGDTKTINIANLVDTTVTTEETTEATTETTTEVTTEATTVKEESTETTTAVKIIKSGDSKFTGKNDKATETITGSVVVDDTTIYSVKATYGIIEGNDAYNEYAKGLAQSFIDSQINTVGASSKEKYNNLSKDERKDFITSNAIYTSSVEYSDDKCVSTIINKRFFRDNIINNTEDLILITDPTGASNITIEDLTDNQVSTEVAFNAAVEKFNKLFEADKNRYYLDKVKNGSLDASKLTFHRDTNGNYVFSAYRGIVASSEKGIISVMFTPSELMKLAK